MENLIQINSIAPVRPGVPAASSGPASPFSQMQSGDTIAALVSESSGESVTLLLPDGSTMHASMKAGQALQTQDRLILQLSSDNGAAPSLRLLEVNGQPVTAQIPVLDMSLMEMNIPASRANIAAASLLGKLGLPVDAQALSRFGELRLSYPSLPPEQAAVFAGSNIPINEQNVSAFSQFVNSPAQAADVASVLQEALSQVNAEAAGNNEAAALGKEPSAVTAESTQHLPPNPDAPESVSAAATQHPAEEASLQQNSKGNAELSATSAKPSPQTAGDSAAAQTPQSRVQATPFNKPRYAEAASPAIVSENDSKTVANALRSIFPRLLPEESASLGKALQKAVPALAPRIAALSEAAASSHAQIAREAAQLGTQFVRQMSFGNEMASLFYTQVPFDYKENRSNAELYVLKRNRGENGIDPSNATIALCLDTANMGRVESLVQVRSQDLSFNFRVETSQIKNIVQDELDSLSRLEFPSQYHYKGASVSVMDSPISPVNAAKLMRDTFGIPESGGIDISI